jgi:hypothetical protein
MVRLLRAIGAVAFVVLALPIGLVAGLLFKGRNCTPEELAAELQALADGQDDLVDGDRLECVSIKDPRLEAIRQEAVHLIQPVRSEDRPKLGQLAERARALRL